MSTPPGAFIQEYTVGSVRLYTLDHAVSIWDKFDLGSVNLFLNTLRHLIGLFSGVV